MTIKYPFTTDGIQWFENDTLADIMNRLEQDDPNNRNEDITDFNIFVTVGSREIMIPLLPETFGEMTEFLKNALKEVDQ